MKKLALVGAIIAGLLSVTGLHAGEVVTLSGKGACAKCHLKSAAKCGAVLQVKTDEGTTNYAVTGKGAKKIRGKEATVKGEVTKADDGSLTIAATEITIGKK
jgi:hypothetical protein